MPRIKRVKTRLEEAVEVIKTANLRLLLASDLRDPKGARREALRELAQARDMIQAEIDRIPP